MAIIMTRGRQDTGVARVDEGQKAEVRSTKDGSIFMADWKQGMILEGRGFMVNLGSFSGPVTGGGSGGLTIESGAPEFVIGIPTNTSILPLRISVELSSVQDTTFTDDDELDILLAVDQDKDNGSSSGSSGTAPSIYNMNTLHNRPSGCWANQQYTATMTAPVLDLELAHVTKIMELHTSTTTGGVEWRGVEMLYEPDTLIVVNGPAMFIGYFGGTRAQVGFACVQWLELPTSYF